MPWYEFTPGLSNPQDPSDQNQYTLYGMTPPPCSSGNTVCAIQANDSGGKPILSSNIPLLREIIRAQHSGVPTTNVHLKP